jgi:hypothetical protein
MQATIFTNKQQKTNDVPTQAEKNCKKEGTSSPFFPLNKGDRIVGYIKQSCYDVLCKKLEPHKNQIETDIVNSLIQRDKVEKSDDLDISSLIEGEIKHKLSLKIKYPAETLKDMKQHLCSRTFDDGIVYNDESRENILIIQKADGRITFVCSLPESWQLRMASTSHLLKSRTFWLVDDEAAEILPQLAELSSEPEAVNVDDDVASQLADSGSYIPSPSEPDVRVGDCLLVNKDGQKFWVWVKHQIENAGKTPSYVVNKIPTIDYGKKSTPEIEIGPEDIITTARFFNTGFQQEQIPVRCDESDIKTFRQVVTRAHHSLPSRLRIKVGDSLKVKLNKEKLWVWVSHRTIEAGKDLFYGINKISIQVDDDKPVQSVIKIRWENIIEVCPFTTTGSYQDFDLANDDGKITDWKSSYSRPTAVYSQAG